MYKRKLTIQQDGIHGIDPQFQQLKMHAKSKKIMPILIAIILSVLCIAIITQPFNIFSSFIFIISSVLVIMHISFLFDTISFYEYGLEEKTWFGLKKTRIAYDDIQSIIEKKHKKFKNHDQPIVTLWQIQVKNQKKRLTIDASAYIGISHMLYSLRHSFKIKNVEVK